MGTTVSHFPPTPANYPVFSLTIRTQDKIKVVDANATVVNIIRANLQKHYGTIQQETVGNDGGTCFKLSGFPFCSAGGFKLSVRTKFFFSMLVADLYRNGWKLWLNADLSRVYDFSTLFFRQCPPPATDVTVCCLSLSHCDKFQLINAPEELYHTLLECVGNLLQDKRIEDHCYEVKMRGYMWYNCSYSQSTNARSLLLNVFRHFRQFGYAYMGTVNLKGTADSIFFIKEGATLPVEHYCVISLNGKDRLRLIDCPKNLVDMTAETIMDKWPGGIQDQRQEENCVEFKMKGYPWYAWNRADAVNSRAFVAEILKRSVANGWAVLTSLDVSRKPTDKGVFVMRSCAPMNIPHFCIAPSDSDKIRVIGADPQMRDHIVNVIRQCWTPGVQGESASTIDCELKMRGCAWHSYSMSDSFALARIMMARILTSLEERGWSVICSADVSAKYVSHSSNNSSSSGHDYPCDVHTWFVAQTSLISNGASTSRAPPIGFVGGGDELPPTYNEVMNGKS